MHKWKKKGRRNNFLHTAKKKTEKNSFFFCPFSPPGVQKYSASPRESPRKTEKQDICLVWRLSSAGVLNPALFCGFNSVLFEFFFLQKFGSRPPKAKSYYFLRGDVFSAPHFHHVLLSARRHMLFFCQFFFCMSWRCSLCTPRRFGIRFFVLPQMSEELFG